MRTNPPPPFQLTFNGADGRYTVDFRSKGEWEGLIDVTIRGVSMHWFVVLVERDANGERSLSGMTTGSEAIWNDQFWFELLLDSAPPVIRYWGDRVLWREDGP